MKIEISEAQKTIAHLKGLLQAEKVSKETLQVSLQEQHSSLMTAQKNEFESTIQRQLGFIDQLLADKKELNEQIENFMIQLKHAESNSSEKVREVEEKWSRELKKNKEAWVAAEKVRKEKWMAEKVGEIKNMTIKGLEPEIERIIAKNKVFLLPSLFIKHHLFFFSSSFIHLSTSPRYFNFFFI